MEKEEELKNTELNQQMDEDDMEGEGYEEEFEDQQQHHQDHMEGEGEVYQEGEYDIEQNPYEQDDAIRNTFYPSQNPMMAPGFGGALRPVSANVMKNSNRKPGFRAKGKKFSGFGRGIDDDFDARTRPRNFLKDKEGLYDDAIKLKKANNNLK